MGTGIEFMRELFESTRYGEFKEVQVPPSLYPYAYLLYRLYNQPTELVHDSGILVPNLKEQSGVSVFSFSGGKDSIGSYLKHGERFSPNDLFYVSGASPLYPEEINRTRLIADELGEHLTEDELGLDNDTWLSESVIKNQFIYSIIMEHYPFIPRAVGFGGTVEVGPQSMAFFHDSQEAFRLFHRFANESWGRHTLIPFLQDEFESYDMLMKRPELIPLLVSCHGIPEQKESDRLEIKERFGVELENEYECGKCYKCAEKGIITHGNEYPKDYLDYCLDIITQKTYSEHNMNGIPTEYLRKIRARVA